MESSCQEAKPKEKGVFLLATDYVVCVCRDVKKSSMAALLPFALIINAVHVTVYTVV